MELKNLNSLIFKRGRKNDVRSGEKIGQKVKKDKLQVTLEHRERSKAHGISERKHRKKDGKMNRREEAHVKERVSDGSCLKVKCTIVIFFFNAFYQGINTLQLLHILCLFNLYLQQSKLNMLHKMVCYFTFSPF